jgi:HEAT repeat protein
VRDGLIIRLLPEAIIFPSTRRSLVARTDSLSRGLVVVSLACLIACPAGPARQAKAASDSTIDQLIAQLGDDSFERRQAAEKQLAKLRGKPVLVALTRAAARHSDLEIRCRAGKVLVAVRAAWVETLIGQLADESPDRRAEARRELAAIGQPAMKALKRAEVVHPNPQVRLRACVIRLIEQLGDDAFARREAAQRELVKIGKPALAALRRASTTSPDLEVRRRATKAIEAISAPPPQRVKNARRAPTPADVTRLIEQLGDDAFEPRDAAQRALAKIGKPALAALRRASIQSKDLEIRNRAAILVKTITDRPR